MRPQGAAASPAGRLLAGVWNGWCIDAPRKVSHVDAATKRAIFDGFVDAVEPLILDLVASGMRDHGTIAAELNKRGVPCWGTSKWRATDIRVVLSRSAI